MVRKFLAGHRAHDSEAAPPRKRHAADIGDMVKGFTVLVEHWK